VLQTSGTPIALLLDMNIKVQRMMELHGSQQRSNNLNINPVGKSGYPSFAFDSIINNMKSADTGSGQEQSYKPAKVDQQNDYNRDDRYDSRAEQPDRRRDISDDEYTRRSDELNRSTENTGERRITDTQKENDRSTKTGSETGESKKYTEKAIDGNQQNNQNTDINEKDNINADDASGEETSENTASIPGTILSDLLNGTPIDSLVQEGEAVTSGEVALQGTIKGTEHAAKTDALLASLINSQAEEAVSTSLSGNTNTAETSVTQKSAVTDALLSQIINSSASKSGESKAETVINTERAVLTSNGPVDPEHTMKMADALLQASGKASEDKTAGTEKTVLNNNAQTVNTEAGESVGKAEEFFNNIGKNMADDKKAELKQYLGKDVKPQTQTAEQNFQITDHNAKVAVSKLISEVTGSLNRESGLNSNSDSATKMVRVEPMTNAAGTLGSSSVTTENGKAGQALHTPSVMRPSAFHEVVDKIVYVVKGDNKLAVTVDHQDFGKLKINLNLEKGMVNVHINTTDKGVREFVENNIQQIVESLSKSGVSVGGFSVGLKNHGNDGFNGFSNRNENGKGFSIDNIQEQEYLKAITNAPVNNGLVSVFA
jgi:flagellar hook-length control protein FliK